MVQVPDFAAVVKTSTTLVMTIFVLRPEPIICLKQKTFHILLIHLINLQVWSVLEDDTETAQCCQLFVETFSPSPKVVLLLGKFLLI